MGGELAVGAGRGSSKAACWALAPMLGGPDRRTLHLLSAETTAAGFDQVHAVGFIETLRVEAPGTGLP